MRLLQVPGITFESKYSQVPHVSIAPSIYEYDLPIGSGPFLMLMVSLHVVTCDLHVTTNDHQDIRKHAYFWSDCSCSITVDVQFIFSKSWWLHLCCSDCLRPSIQISEDHGRCQSDHWTSLSFDHMHASVSLLTMPQPSTRHAHSLSLGAELCILRELKGSVA